MSKLNDFQDLHKATGVTKLRILDHLLTNMSHHPLTVKELAIDLDMEQSCLSHHLSWLRKNGLVKAKHDGKAVVYKLSDPSAAYGLVDMSHTLRKLRQVHYDHKDGRWQK